MKRTVKSLASRGAPGGTGTPRLLLDAVSEGREAGAGSRRSSLRRLDYARAGVQRLPPDGVCIIPRTTSPRSLRRSPPPTVLAVASSIYSNGYHGRPQGGLIDRSQYIWRAKFILKNLYFTTEHMRRHKGIFHSRPPGSGGECL